MNLTNYTEITNTIPKEVTSWSDPVLWIGLFGTIATCTSAIFMYLSVREMKIQRRQEQRRQELLELKQEIKDNIMPLIRDIQNKIPKSQDQIDVIILYTSNSNIYDTLISMAGQAKGTFYENEIQEIFTQIMSLHSFIMYPYSYSSAITTAIHQILERTGVDLYKALIYPETRMELIHFIQHFKKLIEKVMTQQDKINLDNHNNETRHLIKDIKSQNLKETTDEIS